MRNSILVSLFLVAACSRPVAPPTITPPIPVPSARDTLAQRRAEDIERLHAYRVAGKFPENIYSRAAVNVFRDGEGRLCAIANLIHLSGRDDLVDQTVRDNNFLALRDVHDGPIMDWILTSGLTQEEIVMVQGIGYEPSFEIDVEGRASQIAEIQTRLEKAEQALREDTAASLDVAVARLAAKNPLLAYPAAVASAPMPPAVPPPVIQPVQRMRRGFPAMLQSGS